jgi:hypothetical protein
MEKPSTNYFLPICWIAVYDTQTLLANLICMLKCASGCNCFVMHGYYSVYLQYDWILFCLPEWWIGSFKAYLCIRVNCAEGLCSLLQLCYQTAVAVTAQRVHQLQVFFPKAGNAGCWYGCNSKNVNSQTVFDRSRKEEAQNLRNICS